MVLKNSLPADLNSKPRFFKLLSTSGEMVSINDVLDSNGLLVCFICNHCPYVKKIIDDIANEVTSLKEISIGSVAIMSNDVTVYEEDSFDNMKIFKEEHGLSCEYLFDETQECARLYDAQCTPEFYLYFRDNQKCCDYKDMSLKYRGRLTDPKGERSLFNAAKSLVENGEYKGEQMPSIGCSLKWKENFL